MSAFQDQTASLFERPCPIWKGKVTTNIPVALLLSPLSLICMYHSFCTHCADHCLPTHPWYGQYVETGGRSMDRDTHTQSHTVCQGRRGHISHWYMNESPLLPLTPRERRRDRKLEQRGKKKKFSLYSFQAVYYCCWRFGSPRREKREGDSVQTETPTEKVLRDREW